MKKFNETMAEFNKIMGNFEASMSEFEKSMNEFKSIMGEVKEVLGEEPETPKNKINMEELLELSNTPWDLSSWEGITPEEEADLKYQQWKYNWLGCRDKNPSMFKPEE